MQFDYALERISIHAPAWGATLWEVIMDLTIHDFNPRPRVGGDVGKNSNFGQAEKISIHAPAWGATFT